MCKWLWWLIKWPEGYSAYNPAYTILEHCRKYIICIWMYVWMYVCVYHMHAPYACVLCRLLCRSIHGTASNSHHHRTCCNHSRLIYCEEQCWTQWRNSPIIWHISTLHTSVHNYANHSTMACVLPTQWDQSYLHTHQHKHYKLSRSNSHRTCTVCCVCS